MELHLCLFVLFFVVCPQLILGFPLTDDTPTTTVCGGLYNDINGGVVTSPNYPRHYESGRNCDYNIHAPDGYVVRISFTYFDVDDEENEDNCVYDRLHIHDGPDSTFPAIGKAMCGVKLPDNVVSSGRFLTVHFHSGDDSVFGLGFSFHYTMVKDAGLSKNCTMNVCGGNFENFSGCEIQTANYPATYLPNQNCVWTMQAPNPNDRYQVVFKTLRIETSRRCRNNNLKLSDYQGSEKVLCKEKQIKHGQTFTTSGPYLRMAFHSRDETLQERSKRTYDMDHLAGIAVEITLIQGHPSLSDLENSH